MNLIMASVLLLAMLAFQPTLIYGAKGLASAKHRSALVMATESGDVFVRRVRGANIDGDAKANVEGAAVAPPPLVATTQEAANNGGAADAANNAGKPWKRQRNNNSNNNSRKLNKSAFGADGNAANAGRRQSLDKRYSAAVNQQQQHQQLHHGGNNKANKQRQILKSQQHQTHGKRANAKSKTESVEKTVNGEKTQSTCRYAKSAWSECDAKTNMRTRTLTLKKGESNCLPTRTTQKKCKKTCRYEKGSWSECNASSGQMTRQDKLKSTGNAAADSSCEAVRTTNKKCNPAGGLGGKQNGNGKANRERKNKDKAARRTPQPA